MRTNFQKAETKQCSPQKADNFEKALWDLNQNTWRKILAGNMYWLLSYENSLKFVNIKFYFSKNYVNNNLPFPMMNFQKPTR